MKERVTLTIEPDVVQRAKQLAHERETNLSALVEELLRNAAGTPDRDFVEAWAGKFSLAPTRPGDLRQQRMKAKYNLPDR